MNYHPQGTFKKMTLCGVKSCEHYPWRSGTIVRIRPHSSFDVQVNDKVYRHNTHHLTRRYPREIASDKDKDSPFHQPRKALRCRPKFVMPRIPVQATMQKDFEYKLFIYLSCLSKSAILLIS